MNPFIRNWMENNVDPDQMKPGNLDWNFLVHVILFYVVFLFFCKMESIPIKSIPFLQYTTP